MPALPEGSTLALVAPAGASSPERIEQVPRLLESMGWRCKLMPGVSGGSTLDFLSADDDVRLTDLHAAFADPQVDAVYTLRGGYGCARLLDRIDTSLLRAHPKPLIGYSDITTLHALRDALGQPGWHAPMPASDLLTEGGARDIHALREALQGGTRSGQVIAPAMQAHALNRGVSARGRLVGGNLAVYAALLGTPWQPRIEDSILYLEDVGEAPYRVDRMLTQLRLAGLLDDAAGFLVGSFTDEDYPQAVLADLLHATGKPVLAGWPSGHCSPHTPLPLGVEVEMDVAGRRLTLR
ncbi:MAG: LD-carboxypeptidase [Paucibacter sp.]|nr:LD-carboxypeptidase [Roseateles sp.]